MSEKFEDALQATMFNLMLKGMMKVAFDKCITRPGAALTSNEKQCLAMCQDRYIEAFQKTFGQQYNAMVKKTEELQQRSSFE